MWLAVVCMEAGFSQIQLHIMIADDLIISTGKYYTCTVTYLQDEQVVSSVLVHYHLVMIVVIYSTL